MSVSFFSNRIKFKLGNQKKRSAWLNATAKSEGAIIQDINYVFCSDNYLHKINLSFLNHDTLTDIITFDYCPPQTKKQPKTIIGEIYISIPRVKENAKSFNTSFELELNRVMIHGLLHLCGYKDKTKTEKEMMRKKEDLYINNF